jgi:hypothetical protein
MRGKVGKTPEHVGDARWAAIQLTILFAFGKSKGATVYDAAMNCHDAVV